MPQEVSGRRHTDGMESLAALVAGLLIATIALATAALLVGWYFWRTGRARGWALVLTIASAVPSLGLLAGTWRAGILQTILTGLAAVFVALGLRRR